MNDTKYGGPAFPSRGGSILYVPEEHRDQIASAVEKMTGALNGMTLRDYFAAKAMLGIMSCPGPVTEPDGSPAPEILADSDVARLSYALADAMLEARKQKG